MSMMRLTEIVSCFGKLMICWKIGSIGIELGVSKVTHCILLQVNIQVPFSFWIPSSSLLFYIRSMHNLLNFFLLCFLFFIFPPYILKSKFRLIFKPISNLFLLAIHGKPLLRCLLKSSLIIAIRSFCCKSLRRRVSACFSPNTNASLPHIVPYCSQYCIT